MIHEQNEYRFQLSMGKKIIPLRNFLPCEKGKVGEREIAKKITNNSIPILNMHQDLKFQNLNSCSFIPSCNLERQNEIPSGIHPGIFIHLLCKKHFCCGFECLCKQATKNTHIVWIFVQCYNQNTICIAYFPTCLTPVSLF